MNRAFLTHIGITCVLGNEINEIAERLFSGDRSGMLVGNSWLDNYCGRIGEIPKLPPRLPSGLGMFDSRNNRLALAVLQQIQDPVARLRRKLGAERIAVVMGTSTSGIANGEQSLRCGVGRNYNYRSQQQLASLTEFTARYLGLSGPQITVSTACSSSANALRSARQLLGLGLCDAVVVGGVDTLCGMTVKGFHSLGALSGGVALPFSTNRDGINLGEAGAVFIMTREPSEVQLCGVGGSSDAHHMSAPDPKGRGAEASMRRALADAGLRAAAIEYLNLHGTGTVQNDAMEAAAVERVLGTDVLCSSTKPLTGHTLGAAGALEIAFCWLALQRKKLPPHRYDDDYDRTIPPLRLCSEGAAPRYLSYVMSNSFAFGGSNCSVILGRKGE
ncbi:beta-ketoacyl-[acyl-carrier-protein] synthase family protein [Microbulbifer discodermiae]|uniref:beta-ketoacyl-[acyl-carrier-protein] synthase family protein n=1 Tax=Microbulbifer sp. 2201CG32-9 TaxID=3232309 RepID=UPI00345BDB77